MRRKRRNHSPSFKAKVALAQQFDVHPNQIQDWKKKLLDGAEQLFANGFRVGEDTDTQVKALHAKIGELTMERDFLSKALGRDR